MNDEETEVIAALCDIARAAEDMMRDAIPVAHGQHLVESVDVQRVKDSLDRWTKAKAAMLESSLRPPSRDDDTIPDACALFQVGDGEPITFRTLVNVNTELTDEERAKIAALNVGKSVKFLSMTATDPVRVRRTR